MKTILAISFLCGLLLVPGLANATITSLNNDPLALAGCSGLASVSLTHGSHIYSFDLAYAVYDTTVYSANGGFDPSHGQDKYIYAYQIFNSVNSNTDTKTFTVAIPDGLTVDNITYDEAVGVQFGIIPHLEKNNHNSVEWQFSSSSINPNEHSVVLVFTSNSAPALGSTTFSIENNGDISGSCVASSAPEPATIALLGLGTTILLRKK